MDPRVYKDLPEARGSKGSITTVGRGESVDVQIKSKYATKLLSRKHCTFFVEQHQYSGRITHVSVVDDGSTNGTFVDGFEVFADPSKLLASNRARKASRSMLSSASLDPERTRTLGSLDQAELLILPDLLSAYLAIVIGWARRKSARHRRKTFSDFTWLDKHGISKCKLLGIGCK